MNKKREPRLDNLDIVEIEQIRALAHPVHQKIFKLMEQKGACTVGDFSEFLGIEPGEIEGYMHGLLAIGFVDVFTEEGEEFYLPVAKYYRIKKELLEKEEGMDSFREMLVDRLAGFAQTMAHLDNEFIERGRISFHQFKFEPDDFAWAKLKLEDFLKEMMERSKPVLDEDTKLYEMALFFYPQKPSEKK